MQPDPAKKRPLWTRDLFSVAAVVVYLAIAGGAVEAWNFISQKADAFAQKADAFAAARQSGHER